MPEIQFGFDTYNSKINHPLYPKPSKFYMPEWYKSLEKHVQIKKCMPFLDGMLSGYIAELVKDVEVKLINKDPIIFEESVVDCRESSSTGNMSSPNGYNNKHFVWMNPYIIKTDPGYSVLITHPLNRFDLPFITLSAICDSDGIMPSGNIPFFIKEGFEGTIKAGTPIFQIFPFKREPWKSVENQGLIEENIKRDANFDRTNEHFYRDKYWQKKEYN